MGLTSLYLEESASNLHWLDILVIVLYFVMVLGVGLWASFRASTDNAQGYFLAGRNTNWILTGASTFATNIGATMFIGLAGSAASSGIAVVMFEWHAMFMLIALGWLFLPVYRSSGCFTMPQYLKLRYGGERIRLWLAFLTIFITIISSIAGQIYSGALFITVIFNWNLYASIIFILLITAVYTLIGGLTAVLWTDALQTIILVFGSFILAVLSLNEVGGFEPMRNQFMGAAANYTYYDQSLYGNRSCGFPPEDSFHIFRPADDGSYPWPGMIFGLTILATNAWCTDQLCVQRSLSAKNVTHAKAGVLLAAYLKILPFFFFVIPGMCSRVLFPQDVACADPVFCEEICKNPKGCTNIAYPYLVNTILPIGIKGIMMAALLAALMSSLTSIFNSSSTLFTMDIWRFFRPHARESELMVVGRLWTILLMLVGLGWLPILLQVQGSEFWAYSQSISSFLLPPIVVTFVLGIFWPRATEKGAFSGLVVGLFCGITRMALEWSIPVPACGSGEENQQFDVVQNVHYLHFAIILALVTTVVNFTISMLTEPRSPAELRRVTWWTRNSELPQERCDDSDIESDEEEDDATEKDDVKVSTGVKYYLLKWGCGVDNTIKRKRMSKEEKQIMQDKITNIDEDPFWKKVLDINMVICAAVAVFLHGFWA